MSNPNLKPTATLTASSSNLSPHEAIGKANSQSPLCCEEAVIIVIVVVVVVIIIIIQYSNV